MCEGFGLNFSHFQILKISWFFIKFRPRPWDQGFSHPGPCPEGFLWWKFSWDIDLPEKIQSWHHQWLKISEKSETDTRSYQFVGLPAWRTLPRWAKLLFETELYESSPVVTWLTVYRRFAVDNFGCWFLIFLIFLKVGGAMIDFFLADLYLS